MTKKKSNDEFQGFMNLKIAHLDSLSNLQSMQTGHLWLEQKLMLYEKIEVAYAILSYLELLKLR